MIGRNFDDATVQEDKKMWGFDIVDEKGKLKIEVTFQGVQRTFFPEEISSVVLSKMKEVAEAFLGHVVKDTVITVPAYFNDSQRQATKDAGIIAGLNVIRIINEPTAACLAYGFEDQFAGMPQEKTVLIYDLGGGTFDISILRIQNGIFEVIAVSGDTHLGGQDFDINLMYFLLDEFQRKHNKEVKNNKKTMSKLRLACERAKRILSTDISTNIAIESLFEGLDFQSKITRTRFEDLNMHLFKKTILCVEKALDDADMTKADIDDVVLVGGSTRIPKIRELLQEFFNGKNLVDNINADEAVAYGAAIQAAILNGDMEAENQRIQLHDVIALSLGIATSDEKSMSVIVEKNTKIPAKKSRSYGTGFDNQSEAMISVFEGEGEQVLRNHLLGEFVVLDIPKAPAGNVMFDVTFEIDENCILSVTAANRATGQKNHILINKNRLNQDELMNIIAASENIQINNKNIKAQKECIKAKSNLEALCDRLKFVLPQVHMKIVDENVRKVLVDEFNDISTWLKLNPVALLEDYESRFEKLSLLTEPIQEHMNALLFTVGDAPD